MVSPPACRRAIFTGFGIEATNPQGLLHHVCEGLGFAHETDKGSSAAFRRLPVQQPALASGTDRFDGKLAFLNLLIDPDPAKPQRVMKAMLQMSKIDIARLKRAYEQQ